MDNTIEITRQGSKVKAAIRTGATSSEAVFLYWECNSDLLAELLVIRLNQQVGSSIQQIREEEYNQGWKDAKSKKRKETWFSALFRKRY